MSKWKLMKSAQASGKGPHHCSSGFKNPWDSFKAPSNVLGFLFSRDNPMFTSSKANAETVEVIKPNLERLVKMKEEGETGVELIFTWLGHAAVLLTFKGAHVLLDPCLSDRCSPLSFAGPKRIVPVPCPLTDLPKIDAIVISHNHYDHLDISSIKQLAKDDTQVFVPLGAKHLLDSQGIKNVIACDWWDEYTLSKSEISFQIACTPAQHFTGRGVLDRFKSLWSSWVVKTPTKSFFFGGDTGYRSVIKPEDEETAPTCPAFKEIGQKYGPFDIAAIPIGAYSPRYFMSPFHCNPRDSVDIHLDIRSKFSLGIHWGTFVLTSEPVMEPPKLLAEELKKRGLDSNVFSTIKVGESTSI